MHPASRAILPLLAASFACAAPAQTSITARPLRLVLPYSAGSGPDAVARQIGEKINAAGLQWVVDNKPGGNGWIAISDVKRSAPDGQTLMEVDATHMALQPNLYKKLPYDPVSDFVPVVPLYTTHFFVVVGANSPHRNVGELLAAARLRSGNVTYGSWGIGSVAHLGGAMLEHATHVQMTHVPFKELHNLYTAVAAGDVDWAFGTAATVAPLYKAGKVRLLAYASRQRMDGYDTVPTMAEAGGPAGFELSTWVALFAPKNTPQPLIDRVNAAVNKALEDKEVRERFTTFGFQAWRGKPDGVAQAIQADASRFAAITKQANISLD